MSFGAEVTPLPREAAEMVGLAALGWLAAVPEEAERFFAIAGSSADDMRARAGDAEYLGFVLDHLLSDEALLLAFCEAEGIAPDRPFRARAGLPGGDLPHWT